MRFEEALKHLRDGKAIETIDDNSDLRIRLLPSLMEPETMREWRVVEELPEGWEKLTGAWWRHASGIEVTRDDCGDYELSFFPGAKFPRHVVTSVRAALLHAQDIAYRHLITTANKVKLAK